MTAIKPARNYENDIEIDENDLEGEWLTHSAIYLHYSEIWADVCAKRDDAKLKMEWISANIDLDIRKTWDTDKGFKKYGFENKPSEGAIKNSILLDAEYLKAFKRYNKCVKNVNSLAGVKTAFEHKKHALSNLVSLKIGGFYAEPRNKHKDVKRLSESSKNSISTKDNQHKQNLNEKMKRRNKTKKTE